MRAARLPGHPSRRLLRTLVAVAGVLPLLLTGPASPARAAVAGFEGPLRIDNPLFSLRPGTSFVYDGTITDADGVHPHRVIFTVTDMVKRVDDVLTRVIWDRDIVDGELSEAELAFFAQNDHDGVVTMGEYPEEYENGRFAGAPSTWISGRAHAQAGVLVPGHPRVGLRFVQGRAPAVGFFDVGLVKRVHARACAPVGCFDDTTLIEESSPQAPEDGKQTKFYAPEVGLVKIGAEGGDAQEVMTLTRVRHLGAAGMAEARAAVLAQERRAYRVSAPYGHTPPMQRCTGDQCAGDS
jgi:hypothetical protein